MSTTHPTPGPVQTLTAKDGAAISYLTVGSGPALIVIPGALTLAADYAALASALGERFTVHTIERRGRGLSGPQGADYSIAKEVDDVDTLQAHTQAVHLVGHSFGGLVALEAARHNAALKTIAVYEPGVSINGSIPVDWIPAYRQLLAEKKPLDAFVTFVRATGPKGAQRTPPWLMKLILSFVIRGHEREKMFALLPANLLEHQEVGRLDNSYQNYRDVSAGTLLMYGGKSSPVAQQTAQRLAEVLPRAEVKAFSKLDHFGPDRNGPREVAAAIQTYFSA